MDPDEKTNRPLVQEVNGYFVKAAVGGHSGNYAAMLLSQSRKAEHPDVYEFLTRHY